MTRSDFEDKLKTLTSLKSLSPHINGVVHDGTKEVVACSEITAEKKDEVKYSPAERNLIQDQLTKKIFKAVYANDIEAAREAIKDEINAKTADGNTPLHMSAICGHAELIKVFIEKGADVNAKTADGNTPLHIAVRWGHTKAAKVLIENGASVNARDKNGNTPLHKVVLGERKELAKLLIEKGADVNAKTADGNTPLHIATKWGNTETANLLKQQGRM